MEKSVVLVSFCCFFAHICSRPSLLLSTDRVPRQAEKAQPNGCAFLMLFSDVNDLQLARLKETETLADVDVHLRVAAGDELGEA